MGDEPRILRVSHRFPTLYCENMASLLGDETLNLPPDEWLEKFPTPTKNANKKVTIDDMLESIPTEGKPGKPNAKMLCRIPAPRLHVPSFRSPFLGPS